MLLDERAEAGETAMVANTAVRDNVNRLVTTDTALEVMVLFPVRIVVNAASVVRSWRLFLISCRWQGLVCICHAFPAEISATVFE